MSHKRSLTSPKAKPNAVVQITPPTVEAHDVLSRTPAEIVLHIFRLSKNPHLTKPLSKSLLKYAITMRQENLYLSGTSISALGTSDEPKTNLQWGTIFCSHFLRSEAFAFASLTSRTGSRG
ncbi:hypothetical protein RQP46_000116 [Phenoliferia psychrophenolica]